MASTAMGVTSAQWGSPDRGHTTLAADERVTLGADHAPENRGPAA